MIQGKLMGQPQKDHQLKKELLMCIILSVQISIPFVFIRPKFIWGQHTIVHIPVGCQSGSMVDTSLKRYGKMTAFISNNLIKIMYFTARSHD